METQLVVVAASVTFGWLVRAAFQSSAAPTPITPCHCHCKCEQVEKDHTWQVVILLISFGGGILSLVWLYLQRDFEQKRGASPTARGKGVQGLSSRFIQLTQ